MEFQFHNGTINTSSNFIRKVFIILMFQFHNGTINTRLLWVLKAVIYVSIPQRYN